MNGVPMPAEQAVRVISLGELLHQYQLGLVLVAGADSDTGSHPVQWVHVSEIEDPTPFLTPDTVLLTTGARFSALRRQADADAYISRLITAGVAALGVGVGLHWDRVPPRIVSACDRLGLPLFRVPYDTPFIAIVQASVRLLEARDRERGIWSLEAQRAVSNASLHPEGLSAVLSEAAERLGHWVCVVDRVGRIIDFAPSSRRAELPLDSLQSEVRRMVERGVSSARIGTKAGGLQLQTLGRPARGVLIAEEVGPPDAAEHNLLGLVAALATIDLEHRAGDDLAHASVREAVVELLRGEQVELAARLAAGIDASLPGIAPVDATAFTPPRSAASSAAVAAAGAEVVVVRHEAPDRLPLALTEDLRRLERRGSGTFTAAFHSDFLIAAPAEQANALYRCFHTHRTAAGISERAPITAFGRLLEQANQALNVALTSSENGPITYSASLHPGVLGMLDDEPEALRRATTLLEPLRRHDTKHHDTLELSLRTWLAHHGQTSPAAAALGVHRHTLSARTRAAADLLHLDLDSPDVRADLWAALRLSAPTS